MQSINIGTPKTYEYLNVANKNIKIPKKNDKIKQFPPSLFDKLSEKVINKRDLNDSVQVPRSIFKGYFFFMMGTAINNLGVLLKQTKPKSKAVGVISGACLAIFTAMSAIGTFEFVKPYLVKQKENSF